MQNNESVSNATYIDDVFHAYYVRIIFDMFVIISLMIITMMGEPS